MTIIIFQNRIHTGYVIRYGEKRWIQPAFKSTGHAGKGTNRFRDIIMEKLREVYE